MCLESTKQKYVLFSTLAQEDGPKPLFALVEHSEETSVRLFGTPRHVFAPVSFDKLLNQSIEYGSVELTSKGFELTEGGRRAVERLKAYIKSEQAA